MTKIFIQKININKKKEIFLKYDFKYNGIIKEYKINNVTILFRKDKHLFFKENLKNDFILRVIINPFNFYKIHKENIYKEYILSNHKIILKEYDNYFFLEYSFDKDFNNEFLLQI